MKIVMTKTMEGSPNGLVVMTYDQGETYDVSEALGEVFVELGAAKPVPRESAAKPKMDSPSYENKAVKPPANKAV